MKERKRKPRLPLLFLSVSHPFRCSLEFGLEVVVDDVVSLVHDFLCGYALSLLSGNRVVHGKRQFAEMHEFGFTAVHLE